ncbi:MAG: S-methyl-5-thioribose-1-phosphate isomerase [Candidatus Micrarchaeota archaeon]|nr:S-methyl-5-thioribose-1-phosphate isomerase [Candidatus Micrarchaeota archaeon]
MIPAVEKAFRQVKALKIQGAEAVAREMVRALAEEMKAVEAGSREDFLRRMKKTAVVLTSARPTEPALRHAMRFMLFQARKNPSQDAGELKKAVAREAKAFEKTALENKAKIALFGSRLVPHGASVLVHCHSSTIVRVLKKAADDGKRIRVYCTETRPRYQGRVTARELGDYGIKTTLVVDSAANYVLSRMKDTDVVLVGADAITATGDLVNKVGTSLIAAAANEHGIPLYSCTATHKYDPLTLYGVPELIEMRPREEIIDRGMRGFGKVDVLNPAFDVTPARHVAAYVTEIGVLPPQALATAVWKEYGLDKEELF